MCRGECSVLGGDVVFVSKFCWEKEEFSPKTDGEMGLSIGGNKKKKQGWSTGLDFSRQNTVNV